MLECGSQLAGLAVYPAGIVQLARVVQYRLTVPLCELHTEVVLCMCM